MKTAIECIPCFFRQAIEAADLLGASDRIKKQILDSVARAVPEFSLRSTPPEMAQRIHAIVREVTGSADPYASLKRKSHEQAMAVCGRCRDKITRSRDALRTAVELAIAGNSIDFGVKGSLDVRAEIEKIVRREEREIQREDAHCFQYDFFIKQLEGAQDILYLADNVGETVFDRLLLEQIKIRWPGKNICYAVRGSPVLNDAVEKDAYNAGIDAYARIIGNGYDAPGTVLEKSSPAFRRLFTSADVIISKGQGNFESLSGRKSPLIFFLFLVKCSVVAQQLGCSVGTIMLTANRDQCHAAAG
jgi:damage-control phosphatase, subfamily I